MAEGQNKIKVIVKTPKNKEKFEVDENAEIKDVSISCLFDSCSSGRVFNFIYAVQCEL